MVLIKKMFKSYTFYLILITIIICILNYSGLDSKNMLFFFFGYEPILYFLVYKEPLRNIIFDDINNQILLWGYVLRILTIALYGMLLDSIRALIKRK